MTFFYPTATCFVNKLCVKVYYFRAFFKTDTKWQVYCKVTHRRRIEGVEEGQGELMRADKRMWQERGRSGKV